MPDVSLPVRAHKVRGLLSLPRSSRTVPILMLLLLVVVPLITPSRSTLNLLTEIFIMGIFAMSYDILLGYTGIVSFGHALFFGTGAYMTGLILARTGPKLIYLLLAIGSGMLLVTVMALIIGYLSLRLKDVYYTMITLAFAELFFIIAEKWRSVTNGADGFSFRVPAVLQDRVTFYYVSLLLLALILIFLRRFIESPTGRVLQAIRENEKRAEFLGYDVLKFKLISNVIAGVVASLAGVAWALQQRFVSTGVMAVDKTIDALLMNYHGSEYRDYYVYNCSAQIQHKLGAVNAKSFELHNLCSSGPLALQLAKSLMLVHPEIKNALLVVGTRESDLIDYQNERARFMFNFADGAAACLLQRDYECNEVLETEMITDGSFATDVAVYAVGNVSYPQNLRIEQDFGKFETEKARGSKVSYYGLDVLDPVSMKDRLDAVSLTNFLKVIRGAAEKSGYSPGEIRFLAPIFMKNSILDYILKQFDMTPEQSFILKNFGHVQSADAYISLYEGLKLGRIQDGDLAIMLGAGTGYSWIATAVKWGSN